MAKTNKTDSEETLSLTFEQAAKELEDIVEKLNSGSVQLDEMIKLYERGMQLSAHCTKLLGEYDGRIEKAIKRRDGSEDED